MKPSWRSIAGVSLVSALAIAPLLVLSLAHRAPIIRRPAPSVSTSVWADMLAVGGFYFAVSFGGVFVVVAFFVYLRAALDKVDSPFPS